MKAFRRLANIFKPGLRCSEAHRFIDDFLDDELDSSTRGRFVEHIGDCEICKCFLEQYSSTIRLCKSDGKIEPPPELIDSTLEFLKTRGVGNV
jgi:hypothetical protein